nr:hypothetical protein [Clostridioides difficile]
MYFPAPNPIYTGEGIAGWEGMWVAKKYFLKRVSSTNIKYITSS